jgi:hypothetical protein
MIPSDLNPNLHISVMIPAESSSQACLQACRLLKQSCFMTQSLPLKLTMIDPSKDQPHYFTYLSQSGVSTKNLKCSVFSGMVASVLLG